MNLERPILIGVSLTIAGFGVHRGLFAEIMLELSEYNHLTPWKGGVITGLTALVIFFVVYGIISSLVQAVRDWRKRNNEPCRSQCSAKGRRP